MRQARGESPFYGGRLSISMRTMLGRCNVAAGLNHHHLLYFPVWLCAASAWIETVFGGSAIYCYENNSGGYNCALCISDATTHPLPIEL
eukprot:scaffold114748_cov19-Prasinocladus_malaysianus.AAC.1